MTLDTNAWIAAGVLAVGILSLAGGILKWVLPPVVRFMRTVNRGLLELTGTPDEYDRADNLVKHGTPSLSAQIGDIKVIISDQGKQNQRLTALETTVADLSKRVTDVERLHAVERITGNVAQAKVVDAIAEANRRSRSQDGAIDIESDQDSEGNS